MKFRTLMIVFNLVFVALASFASENAMGSEGGEALKYLPVQDAGRVKPFDTFARETLQLIHGSQTFKPKSGGEKREAVEIVMTWMLVPQYWDQQPMVEVAHRGLKESLNLPFDEKFFTPASLFENGRLGLVMQELAAKRETKEKLDPYFQAAQRLESQLGMYQAIKQGTIIRVAPPAPVPPQAMAGGLLGEPDRWLSISELDGELKQKFSVVARAFIHSLPTDGAQPPPEAASNEPPPPSLAAAVKDFTDSARIRNPDLYPSEKMISIEVHYKALHPFLISWILYLTAAILLAVAWQTNRSAVYKAGWALAIIAFFVHSYGFGLRMYITGRPPVSNMYESVIWVSWGTLVFSFVFEYLNRRKFILMSGAIVGVLCLIVADLAPTILDSSLQPLEPVLRSNMWLTVHVLTITLSYSAFFLAWALANLGLGFILRGDKPTDERPRLLTQAIYRSIAVGVVLLAAGTILGGVWADYSWGRFWGWDPKETWAFIALMGYLALLHSRLAGLVQNFGMMVGAIVSFNLVIMAWYGVNFVLGAGLHSYGFGAGGVEYVSAFVALDLIYAGYVAYINSQRGKQVAA